MSTPTIIDLLKAEAELLANRRTYVRLMQTPELSDYEYCIYQFIFAHHTWRIARVRLSQANKGKLTTLAHAERTDRSIAMSILNEAAANMQADYKELKEARAKFRRSKLRLVG